MNKYLIFGCFVFALIGSYFLSSNIFYQEPESTLDPKFNSMVNELKDYNGAMIVSYDTITGEIINKRKPGELREAGVMSISEDAYDINKEGWPEGTIAISRDMSPSQVIKYVEDNN